MQATYAVHVSDAVWARVAASTPQAGPASRPSDYSVSMNPSGAKEAGPSRQGRPVRLAVPLLAVALMAAGAVFLSLPVRQQDFGWFAYAPLSQQVFAAQGLVIMDTEKWAGVVLAGLGLLTLAFWSGFRAGRNSSRRGDGRPPAQ